MRTEITTSEADRVTDLIGVPKELAEFMGITIHTDISEITTAEFSANAEISVEDAEIILLAATINDEPTIWGAYQTLMAILDAA